MAEPLYDYVVPQPSMGKLSDLLQGTEIKVLNGKLIDTSTYDPNTGVIRWSQANARLAERIARREFERYGGAIFAETNLPAIQQLVAVVAVDPCGTFSAMLSDDQWNWAQWAAFCYLVAAQSTEVYTQLIGNIVAGYCYLWSGAAQQDTILYDPLGNDSYSIRLDPWYQIPYVYQLGDAWPYVFESPPAGYDGPYEVPAYALPPGEPMIPPEPIDPGDLPPGELPPGETPPGGDLPDLPPGEQPPAVDPVVVEEAKSKTSDTAIVIGTLAGIAAVGVVGWALTRRKANPVRGRKDWFAPVVQTPESDYKELRALIKTVRSDMKRSDEYNQPAKQALDRIETAVKKKQPVFDDDLAIVSSFGYSGSQVMNMVNEDMRNYLRRLDLLSTAPRFSEDELRQVRDLRGKALAGKGKHRDLVRLCDRGLQGDPKAMDQALRFAQSGRPLSRY